MKTNEVMEQVIEPIDTAVQLVKQTIREKNVLRTQFDPSKDQYCIGYGRDLRRNPLDAEELFELIHHGLSYPTTGSIRVAYAEYILHKDVADAAAFIMDLIGGVTFTSLSTNRQKFLIHMTYDLGILKLSKMKKFVSYVKKYDWELAVSCLLAYDSPFGRTYLLDG